MASKIDKTYRPPYDKPYRPILKIDENKIKDVIAKAEELDSQELLQYSFINKIPLALVSDINGNNLIHLAIMNTIKTKS